MADLSSLASDFPVLAQSVYGKRLVFLDSAASAQKPRAVLEAMDNFYRTHYANIHRGVHYLSEKATEDYEAAREAVRKFIHAKHVHEILFVRGATEGINLVASSFARAFLKAGDEIILSAMEHHSNIVPWQMLREERGIVLKILPMNERGELAMERFAGLFSPRTKLVSIAHVSNALGTVNPVEEIIRITHEHGAKILIDGCQAVPHRAVDVQVLDADFYVFSGHKLYGPTGVGVVYGKETLLNAMPPYQGGGDMISSVTFERTEYAALPNKFEAGTPAIAEAVGLHAAIDYVQTIGFEAIAAHEKHLLHYAVEQLSTLPFITLIGTPAKRSGAISFTVRSVHPHDVGTILDRAGVAVRVGHHCAQPVMEFFGVPATVRASFALYNSTADVDALVEGLKAVNAIFG